jgi:Sec-independent protein secretion pathway component TatC
MTFNIFSKSPQLTAESFRSNRKYFYLMVLIIGACFTDSPSGKEQLTIAVPLMLAFEWAIALMDRK